MFGVNIAVEALNSVIQNSPYFECLFRNSQELGFIVGEEHIIVLLDYSKKNISFKFVENEDQYNPELWVEIDRSELLNFHENKRAITKICIRTSKRGQVLHPSIERVIQRIFSANTTFPVSDRVDLVYSCLFGFNEPQVLWRSGKSEIEVLKYTNALRGLDLYITSGFSNPGAGTAKVNITKGKPSGSGYELMAFANPSDAVIGKELSGWAQYVESSGSHILRGQWLEYNEKHIPGTDLSAFIVVHPLEIPDIIPVADGYCQFNLLLGVTSQELDHAKKNGVYEVAKALAAKGYVNYSPAKRKSVL